MDSAPEPDPVPDQALSHVSDPTNVRVPAPARDSAPAPARENYFSLKDVS